ncbi:tRNA threonylcarbamoyladenosine dehydratase [Halobacteriovorax sp. HFRX-2_2]|uniref:tRNA threonylcarbamoyladenosine dehydratase n=1 Tax=unclassified Halobacteriovorax TaxID=2639665 RepID=UPI003711CC11
MSNHEQRFNGIAALLGAEAFSVIKDSHFMIIGLGGVGTWCVESIARLGVNKITLVDLDDICVSNTNRQLHAHDGNYGKMKADALKERIATINPDCEVVCHYCFFNEKNMDKIFAEQPSIIIDTIDAPREKAILINECYKREVKIVSSGAIGGKVDPTMITVAELSKTKQDMLYRKVRQELKKKHLYPLGRSKAKVQCVYSPEPSKKIKKCEIDNTSKALKLDCDGGLGTATYMTGTVGFLLSHVAVKELLK